MATAIKARLQRHFPEPLLLAGIAVLLASIAALTYAPAPRTAAPPVAAAAAAAAPETDVAPARTKCDGCGQIDSIRRIPPADHLPASYEITVRMRDGSTRVSSHANPGSWRTGDRIVLIGGTNPPGR